MVNPRSERGWAMLIKAVKSGKITISEIQSKLGDMAGYTVEAAMAVELQQVAKKKIIDLSQFNAAYCDRNRDIKEKTCGHCLPKSGCDVERQLGYGLFNSV